jgi:cell division protein FtsN
MNNSQVEPASQLVLDNPKLIGAFALLILLCGIFFVIGFMEGRRQGVPATGEVARNSTDSADSGTTDAEVDSPSEGQEAKPIEGKSVREQLQWYESVNERAGGKTKNPKATESADAPVSSPGNPKVDTEATPSQPRIPASAEMTPPKTGVDGGTTTYTVQVGAFRQRQQAEAKAALLETKGYQYTIEAAGTGDQFYFLKVGRFSSRAEAVAVQLRLRKDGFATFIKTNR